MADVKIKVGADVGGPVAGVAAIGKATAEANKQAEKSLSNLRKELRGYTGDIEKARKAFEQLQQSGARGTRNLKGKSFEEWAGGGFQDFSVNPAEAARHKADVLRRLGMNGGGSGPGTQSAFGFGGHSLFRAGQGVFNSAFPVGGVGGQIMQNGVAAARASSGGLFSGGGLARVGMGAAIGGLAFGAIKGIRSIAGKVGQAEDEASNYADMTRQVGAVSSAFGDLRESIRTASAGMGIAYNEAAKLGAVYAHEAGIGPRTRQGLAGEVNTSMGFARGFGLDPESGVRLFGQARHAGVTANDADNRKLALQIGDAVASKGEFSRAGELIDAVHSFVAVQSRGLVAGNVGAFLQKTSAFGALGIPGLGLSESAGLAGKLNAGMMNPGGGEAGGNFMLAMLQRMSPDATAMDLSAVQSGGYMAGGSDVFGRKSAQYKLAQARGDKTEMARLDRMSGAFGKGSFGDLMTQGLLDQNMGTQATISATGTFFGLSSPESAAALAAHLKGGGGSPLSAAIKRLGIDPTKMNSGNFGVLAQLMGGSREDLMAQGKDLLGRTGEGKLSQEEAAKLRDVMQNGGTDSLRDSVMQLSASRGNMSEGDKSRQAIADLGNVWERFAGEAIPLLTAIRDAVVKTAEKAHLLDHDTANTLLGRGAGGGPTTAADVKNPNSFRNPKWDALDKEMEQRVGLPAGLLSSIRRNGEKTNNDVVSSAGARSVYQVIPDTRAGALKKWGIDAYAGDSQAAEVAARLLKDDYSATGGNIEETIRRYHAGTAGKRGGINDAYAQRVMAGMRSGLEYEDAPLPSVGETQGENYGHEGRGHQTATIRLINQTGTPVAPPVTFSFGGAPQPTGARRGSI